MPSRPFVMKCCIFSRTNWKSELSSFLVDCKFFFLFFFFWYLSRCSSMYSYAGGPSYTSAWKFGMLYSTFVKSRFFFFLESTFVVLSLFIFFWVVWRLTKNKASLGFINWKMYWVIISSLLRRFWNSNRRVLGCTSRKCPAGSLWRWPWQFRRSSRAKVESPGWLSRSWGRGARSSAWRRPRSPGRWRWCRTVGRRGWSSRRRRTTTMPTGRAREEGWRSLQAPGWGEAGGQCPGWTAPWLSTGSIVHTTAYPNVQICCPLFTSRMR